MSNLTAEQFKAVQRTHEQICATVEAYAGLAAGWDPSEEGDWNDFKDSILSSLLGGAELWLNKKQL